MRVGVPVGEKDKGQAKETTMGTMRTLGTMGMPPLRQSRSKKVIRKSAQGHAHAHGHVGNGNDLKGKRDDEDEVGDFPGESNTSH